MLTPLVGEVDPEIQKLLSVTKECLTLAIEQAVTGKRIGDIGAAVQTHAEANGYGVVRELVGHDWEENSMKLLKYPTMAAVSPRLVDGMVLAIEPMINLGTREVLTDTDGWTIVTKDRKVALTLNTTLLFEGKADVLSSLLK